jgi:hypothetical protein
MLPTRPGPSVALSIAILRHTVPMQVYVDESERRDYYLGVTLVRGPVQPLRAALRALTRSGQRRIHFSKEGDSRRRELLSAMAGLGLTARIYCSPRSVKESREICLSALIEDIAPAGASLLVLESRESMNHLDVLTIDAALRKHGSQTLEYRHLSPYEEPLLWVSDAVAWAMGAGRDWRRRIEPMLDGVVRLGP